MSVDDPDIGYGEDGRPEWTPLRDKPLPLWLKLMFVGMVIIVSVAGIVIYRFWAAEPLAGLQPGECFNHVPQDDYTSLLAIPCTTAHDAEVIHSWVEPGDLCATSKPRRASH